MIERLLPPHRRDWGEALRAERSAIPPGRARVGWAAGGVWLVLRFGWTPWRALIAVTAAAVLAWGRDLPTLAMVAILATAPLAARRAASRPVRMASYAALCALVPVSVALTRTHHVPVEGAWILAAVMAVYAAGILWITAQAALGAGAIAGMAGGLVVFAQILAGGPLSLTAAVASCAAPFAVGALSRDREAGALGGLLAGGLGGLIFVALAVPAMLASPGLIPSEWFTPVAPFSTEPLIGDAALSAETFLLVGPLVGALLGLIGGAVRECPGRDSNPHARKGRAF